MIEDLDDHLEGVRLLETDLLEQTSGVYVNYDGTPIILLKKGLDQRSKLCILAEEIGHHLTTKGDITDQTQLDNIKQEITARRWAYSKLVTADKIVAALKDGAQSVHETAEHLGVTDDFFIEALEYLKIKKGPMIHVGEDVLILEPLHLMRGGNEIEWISA